MAKNRKRTYACPHCGHIIECVIPFKAQVTEKGFWDTSCSCPECEGMYMKQVYPSGQINLFIPPFHVAHGGRGIRKNGEIKQ